MKQQKKFNPGEQQEQAASHQAQEKPGREFANVEELLRYDARQTRVPSGIAERLRKSSGDLPKPARSWWRRLFGGNNS